MKTPAAIFVQAGKPLIVDEINIPEPGPTHVVVKQYASGVCHSQLHELSDPKQVLPRLLGHESTGVVAKAGSAVTHVKEGDNVILSWLPRTAGGLPRPQPAALTYAGQELRFPTGSTGLFTWAEHTIVDQQMVVRFDQGIATDVTSIIGCAVMTGAGAVVNAAQVRPGNSVAIFGVGGVGLAAVQACANLGAFPIIVVDVSDDKLAFAAEFGATLGINAAREDPVASIREVTGGTPGSGVDFAFDAIGVASTMEQVLQVARSKAVGARDGGVAVVIGILHGPPPNPDWAQIVAGKAYRGAPGGCCQTERDFPIFLRWFGEGKMPLDRLVTQRYRLDQINEACDALAQGQIAGRAIVEF